MRFKSEVNMTIKYIKALRLNPSDNIFEICFKEKLNADMVGRSLIKLYKKHMISRNKRGPHTRYVVPPLSLGEVVLTLQEISLGDSVIEDVVIESLSKIII
jgi:hypothetical protein